MSRYTLRLVLVGLVAAWVTAVCLAILTGYTGSTAP